MALQSYKSVQPPTNLQYVMSTVQHLFFSIYAFMSLLEASSQQMRTGLFPQSHWRRRPSSQEPLLLNLPCSTQSCLSWHGTWPFLTGPAPSFQPWRRQKTNRINRVTGLYWGSEFIILHRKFKGGRTFSCWEWRQSARFHREAWRASPATTRHPRRWWHGGCRRRRSSGLGWAGSCPSSGHSQTKLCKNKITYISCTSMTWCFTQNKFSISEMLTMSNVKSGNSCKNPFHETWQEIHCRCFLSRIVIYFFSFPL